MRRILDGLYIISGALSAFFILAICSVVALQVIFNIITRLRITDATLTISSYATISGFLLAAASFMALAYTLTRGGHIRVTLLFSIAGDRFRYAADLFCLAMCGVISGTATWFMWSLVLESYEFGDKSSGILAIPIWIGQAPLFTGLAILTIAFTDLFVQTLRQGKSLPELQHSE
ncbi:MAG: TRAP transporter small permease [Rhodomicrobiaceae bacterium]